MSYGTCEYADWSPHPLLDEEDFREAIRVSTMPGAGGLVALLLGIPLSFAGVKIGVSLGMVYGPSVNVYLISATVAALLVAVAVAATWAPARRASRVDPATTLRSQ